MKKQGDPQGGVCVMKLKSLTIKNYRGIKSLELNLHENTTVLIGENNTGKTTILNALTYSLERVKSRNNCVFSEYDYHLPEENSDPKNSDELKLILKFAESEEDEWGDELVRSITDVITYEEGKDLRQVKLQITSSYDTASFEFKQDWAFLNAKNKIMPKTRNSYHLTNLQKIRPIFYLSALRDAGKEFGSRSTFWGPFLKNTSITDELKSELENELSQINNRIVEAHKPFSDIITSLKNVQNFVDLSSDDVVSIEAVPSRVFDMLGKTQVNLSSASGSKLPIHRHGDGTQSLAVLLLFDAFLGVRLKNVYDKLAEPILALEEPEAHLHPSAIRSLWKTVNSFSGQKVIASHSGELLSEVPISSLRRMYRRSDGEIDVASIKPDTLSLPEEKKFKYHVQYSRGELLLANCWLLFEGETEFTILEAIARSCKFEIERRGVRLIEYRQVDIEIFIKVANDLGIDWVCLLDNDSQGGQDKKKAHTHLGTKNETDHIISLPSPNMEIFLCNNGFGDVYKSYIKEGSQKNITASPKTPDYWNQVCSNLKKRKKIEAIHKVADEIEDDSAKAPEFLKSVLEKAIAKTRKVT